jgi:WD40 repeat protein
MLGLRRLGGALLALGVRHPRLATLLVGATSFAALWLAPLHRPRAETARMDQRRRTCETVLFSKDGSRFAAYFVEYGKGVVASVSVELYDTATGAHVATMLDEKGIDFHDMNTNRDVDRFAARRKDGTTSVWSMATGEKVATEKILDLDRSLVVGDGGRLLLFERDPVRLRDPATDEIVAELPADGKSRIVAVDFDRDQYVVRCTVDGFHLHRRSNLKRIASLPALHLFNKQIDFTLTSRGMSSDDGQTCVVVEVRQDDVPGMPGMPLRLLYHRDTGRWHDADRWRSDDIHLSPNGRLAARVERVESNWLRISARILRVFKLQAREDAYPVLHVFDTVSRKTVAKMNEVGPAWFSPDSATLVSPGPDSTVQLWDFPIRKPWHIIATSTMGAAALTASLLLPARRRSRPSEPERQAKGNHATT